MATALLLAASCASQVFTPVGAQDSSGVGSESLASEAATTPAQASEYLAKMKTFSDRYQTCVPDLLKNVGKNDADPAKVETLRTEAAALVKDMQGVSAPKEMAAGHKELMSVMALVGKLASGKQDPYAALMQAYELIKKTKAGTGKYDAATKEFMEAQGIKTESTGALFARETNTTQSAGSSLGH